jgi:hypothetical protein
MISRHGTTSRADVLAFCACHPEGSAHLVFTIRTLANRASAESQDSLMKEASAFSFYTSAMNMP